MNYQDRVNHVSDDITRTYVTVRVIRVHLFTITPLERIWTCILL